MPSKVADGGEVEIFRGAKYVAQQTCILVQLNDVRHFRK